MIVGEFAPDITIACFEKDDHKLQFADTIYIMNDKWAYRSNPSSILSDFLRLEYLSKLLNKF